MSFRPPVSSTQNDRPAAKIVHVALFFQNFDFKHKTIPA
jgi:hypothetical protein